MKKQCKAIKALCVSLPLLASLPLLVSWQANAAPGALEDRPLTLAIDAVQPNILLMLDDSTSMRSSLLLTADARSEHPADSSSKTDLDFTPDHSYERRRLCVGFNALAYNEDPLVTYTPWLGDDKDGDAHQNMTLNAARYDPYRNNTNNIRFHRYVQWSDDGDGVYEAGECEDEVSVNRLSAANQQKYANWYTYYRSRRYVAKRALSEVISNSPARVGLTGLYRDYKNDNLGGIPIKDNTVAANKSALLKFLFGMDAVSGTTLASTLYEAGRYFEYGKKPNYYFFKQGTLAANANLHDASTENTVDDNSPILNADNGGSCQQNFSVLFSDGFARREFAFNIGNTDGNNNSAYDGERFKDNWGNTLADVAMHYLERDLVPNTVLNNDSISVDDARIVGGTINHQHMTTYTVAFGVEGANPDGGPDDSDPASDFPYAWPRPISYKASTIDDMQHAAWNGRGQYLNASNPQDLIDDLNNVFADITARTTVTSAAASVSSGLIGAGTQIFRTEFDSGDWTGNLFAYQFDSDGNVDVDTPTWQAATKLNDDISNNGFASARDNIYTYHVDTDNPIVSANRGVDLVYANLDPTQKADLTAFVPAAWTAAGGTGPEYGAALLDFLKGDNTHEESVSGGRGVFRDRDGSYLGALINSSPQYMGPPNDKYPDEIQGPGFSYNAFKSLTSSTTRPPLVFVGGNDGMLHAFDATSGNEVFAYVPGLLADKLPALATTTSPYPYASYVDSTPTVRDVYLTTDVDNGRNTGWRSYLVGGLRNGGKSIYALDVTNPSDSDVTAQDIVKFEYTHADLGYIHSRPQIAKLNSGQWVAIVGNGYNADGVDGHAKLFIIDLATGQPITTNGGGIIDTGVGNNAGGSCLDTDADDGDPASDCNGLSSPTLVDLNGDFKVDRIYAGDLHGNMWVFDVSSPSATWAASKLFTANRNGTGACTTASCRQPITTKPEVTLHPSRRSSSTQPNILVYFGTGQYIAEGDNATSDTQSFYAVWDRGVDDLVKGDLVPRAFSGTSLSAINIVGDPVAYDGGTASGSGNFGWSIDLSGSIASAAPFLRGRVVINPVLSGQLVFFVASVPRQGASCEGGNVMSYLVTLDLKTGLPPSFNPFDPDGDGDNNGFASPVTQLGSSVSGFEATGVDPTLIITNEDGSIETQGISNAESVLAGRKSWSIIK
ncbi:MAG: type IV pilus assembly protein PilY1 [Cellvibrionaceae bacterium]|jgi:type IV pilus assembly protein PilY1